MINAPEDRGWGVVSAAAGSAAGGSAADAAVGVLCAGGHERAPERLSSSHGPNHGAASARHMPM
jgi:hypothetical protein